MHDGRAPRRPPRGQPPDHASPIAARSTQTLEALIPYFGVEAEPQLVEAHRAAIAERFGAEVQEIVRLCPRLREKERFTILRGALRLSYESAVGR